MKLIVEITPEWKGTMWFYGWEVREGARPGAPLLAWGQEITYAKARQAATHAAKTCPTPDVFEVETGRPE